MISLVLALGSASAGTTWDPSEYKRSLVVKVVDDQGDVLPMATVRIDDENLRHRVNQRTGKWRTNAIYPSSTAQDLDANDVVQLTVSAPGHLPTTVKYRLARNRNSVTLALSPLAPRAQPTVQLASMMTPDCAPGLSFTNATAFTLDPDTLQRIGELEKADPHLTAQFSQHLLGLGPQHVDAALSWADIAVAEAHSTEGADYVGLIHGLFRVRALAHHVRWQEAELDLVFDPSHRKERASEQARLQAVEIAADWKRWANAAGQDTELAGALCMAVARRQLDCEL